MSGEISGTVRAFIGVCVDGGGTWRRESNGARIRPATVESAERHGLVTVEREGPKIVAATLTDAGRALFPTKLAQVTPPGYRLVLPPGHRE